MRVAYCFAAAVLTTWIVTSAQSLGQQDPRNDSEAIAPSEQENRIKSPRTRGRVGVAVLMRSPARARRGLEQQDIYSVGAERMRSTDIRIIPRGVRADSRYPIADRGSRRQRK